MTSLPPFSKVDKGISAAGVTLRLLPITKCKSAVPECPNPKSRSFSLKSYRNNQVEMIPH